MSKNELIKKPQFADEIIQLISPSKQKLSVTVNAELTLLYWHIGQRIHQFVGCV